MPSKYPICTPDEVIKVIRKFGFVFVSQKGSHMKYSNGKYTTIIPNHDIVYKGTLKSILDQTHISYDEFMKEYKK